METLPYHDCKFEGDGTTMGEKRVLCIGDTQTIFSKLGFPDVTYAIKG